MFRIQGTFSSVLEEFFSIKVLIKQALVLSPFVSASADSAQGDVRFACVGLASELQLSSSSLV